MKKVLPILILSLLLVQACVDNEQRQTVSEDVQLIDTAKLIKTGVEVAMSTFGVLSKELQQAMKEGGVQKAVPYCNINALPIADSLSEEFGVVIRRVTDKPRNPADTMNQVESEVFASFTKAVNENGSTRPTVVDVQDGAYFFAPILLQEFCQKCHGTPGEQISEEDYALIKELYPDDKAIGYKPGQLRGMWSIYYPEDKVPYKSEEKVIE